MMLLLLLLLLSLSLLLMLLQTVAVGDHHSIYDVRDSGMFLLREIHVSELTFVMNRRCTLMWDGKKLPVGGYTYIIYDNH